MYKQIIELCFQLFLLNLVSCLILLFLTLAKDELIGSSRIKYLDGLYYRTICTLPFTFVLLGISEILFK